MGLTRNTCSYRSGSSRLPQRNLFHLHCTVAGALVLAMSPCIVAFVLGIHIPIFGCTSHDLMALGFELPANNPPSDIATYVRKTATKATGLVQVFTHIREGRVGSTVRLRRKSLTSERFLHGFEGCVPKGQVLHCAGAHLSIKICNPKYILFSGDWKSLSTTEAADFCESIQEALE